MTALYWVGSPRSRCRPRGDDRRRRPSRSAANTALPRTAPWRPNPLPRAQCVEKTTSVLLHSGDQFIFCLFSHTIGTEKTDWGWGGGGRPAQQLHTRTRAPLNMRGCARRSTKGGGKGGTGKKERGEEGWPASQRRASSATTSSRRKVSRESAKGTNQGRGGFFWKDGGQKEEEEEGGFLSLKELFRQAEEAVLETHTKDAAEVSCCALCSHSQ